MGRPEKPIDWDVVDFHLEAGCLGTEIATHFDMNPETFYRKCQEKFNIGFTEYSTQKRQKGESALKAAQYARAIGLSKKGDTTLLMFLGRVRLNQKEVQDSIAPPNDTNLTWQDAFIKSEASRMETEKKIQKLEEELNAIKPKTDPVLS